MSDFDDIFKKGLHDHKVDVPDDLWSRIEQEVNPKKKFRKEFVLLAIGFLAFSSLGIWYMSTDQGKEIQETKFSESSKILAAPDSDDVLRDYLTAKNAGRELSSEEIERISDSENSQSTEVIEDAVGKTISTNSKIGQDKAKLYFESYSSVSLYKSDNTSSFPVKEDIKPVQVFELDTKSSSFQNPERKIILPDVIWALDALPDYDKQCPKFGKRKTGYFSVETYHSSDMIMKALIAKSSEDENYAAARMDSESQLYSFSNGVGVTWHHIDGIGIGLGIERSQINELFSFVEQDAREVKVLITLDTLFNTDGTYTTSIDTKRIEVQGVKKNYVTNQYTSIDLPISLSYRWDRKRWGIGVRGAVYLNLLFNQKGRVLGINGKPAWITEGNQNELDAYRAKSGLKFDGSIDVTYHLTHMWDVYMQPYFRYNENTYTQDNYQLDHFMNTMGVRAGIRYNFGF